MTILSRSSDYRHRRRRAVRRFAFESLEHRNMPAVLVDVGHHFVEPDMSGQTISLSVVSTEAIDAAVAGFDLRAQIVTPKHGPYFQGVRFAGDLWSTFPHVESGSPFPTDRTLASGHVAFTRGFEARADGTLVTLTIDTTGIPAGSYELRLVGTKLGSSSFRSSISETITNGTLQVRSIWQNPDNPNDSNGDGRVSPLDVLLLLNELSKKGSHELPMPSPGEAPRPYFDVNGDGYLSPLDPLGAINCLNGFSCVTTPKPILAQVSPNFAPGLPDSTSIGEPVPDNSKPKGLPPEKANPGDTADCEPYEFDEYGNPILLIRPTFCEGFDQSDSYPLLVEPNELETTDSAGSSVNEQPLAGSEEVLPASPIATELSPQYVNAVIFGLANELSDNETSEELVDLGLIALSL